jgi:hypothetical protein
MNDFEFYKERGDEALMVLSSFVDRVKRDGFEELDEIDSRRFVDSFLILSYCWDKIIARHDLPQPEAHE